MPRHWWPTKEPGWPAEGQQYVYTLEGPDGSFDVTAGSEEEALEMARLRSNPPEAPPAPGATEGAPADEQPERQSISKHFQDLAKHPLARLGLEIAGGVGLSMLPIPGARFAAATRIPGAVRAAKALGNMPKAARMLGLGGAEGAATGAAFAPEGERTRGAVGGGLAGAAFATALPAVAKSGRAVMKYVGDFKNPAGRADHMLHEYLQGRPTDILQNPDARVGDLAPELVGDVHRRAPSPAAERLAAGFEGRQDDAFDAADGAVSRLTDQVSTALDNPPTPSTITAEGLQRKAAREKLFERAYQQDLPEETKALAQTLRERPAFKSAESSARERLANLGVELEGIDTVHAADKTLAALRAAKEKALSAKDNDLARIIDGIYDPLQESLESASPAYRTAMEASRRSNLLDDAVVAGRQVFDSATREGGANLPSVTTERLSKMGNAERRYFRAGVMDGLFKGASQQDKAANIITAFGSRGTRAQLKTILDADSYATFQKFVSDEKKFWKTYVQSQGGQRADLPDTLEGVIQTGGDVLRAGAWYSPFAFNTLLQNLAKKLVHKSDDAMYEQLVSRLTGRQLPDAPTSAPVRQRLGLGAAPAAIYRQRDNEQ